MRKIETLIGILSVSTSVFAMDLSGGLDIGYGWMKNYGGKTVYYSLKGNNPVFTVYGQIGDKNFVGKLLGTYHHFSGEKFKVNGSAEDNNSDLTYYNVEGRIGYRLQDDRIKIIPYVAIGWDKYKVKLNDIGIWYRDRVSYWKLGFELDKRIDGKLRGFVDIGYGKNMNGQSETKGLQIGIKKRERYNMEFGIKYKSFKISAFVIKKELDYNTGLHNRYRMLGVKTGFMF